MAVHYAAVWTGNTSTFEIAINSEHRLTGAFLQQIRPYAKPGRIEDPRGDAILP